MGMLLLFIMVLAFGIISALSWGAFLILLGWSAYTLLTAGLWPDRPLNFYQAYFEHPFTDPYGSVWIGWYLLGAAIIGWLMSYGCVATLEDHR
jgi:hypothetical protein